VSGSLDATMMARALFHAARGQGRTTPNPMVGAVVVSHDGVIVGHGWHHKVGEPHAEVHALNEAAERARGGTLYVTLEPCCHVGRTGPCTQRIVASGIERVVAAMKDPDPRVNGRGFAELEAHGVTVAADVCIDAARRLNEAFITAKTRRRPFIMFKAATSLDGRVAAARGRRTALSSRLANRRTQQLRASVDAIAVGIETLLVDDPLLTVRECYRARPLVRVVFDRKLRTPPTAKLFATLSHGQVVIVSEPGADRSRATALRAVGATLLEKPSLQSTVEALLERDVASLLVEGGPTLQGAMARAGLVDRIHLVVTPHTLGDSGVPWIDNDVLPTAALQQIDVEPRGPDIWIEADVHGHN
jgi:diaminohydroxyphosphoribosylaminopyrimidine deaminase/5-amino-6-(5-phosphoribosylamino)uracil reductase